MEDKRLKILIVDDEPDVADTLRHILSLRRYAVTTAYRGEEALGILEKEKMDLIILDLMMHGIKGDEVAKIINKKYPDIKIIVVTAYPDAGRMLSQKVRLEGLFIKPFGIQDLCNKLSMA